MALHNDYRIVDDDGELPSITVQSTMDDEKNPVVRLAMDDGDVDMTRTMAADLLTALKQLLDK